MTPEQLQNWIAVAAALANVLGVSLEKIRNFVRVNGNATDAELDAVLQGIADDAARREQERRQMAGNDSADSRA